MSLGKDREATDMLLTIERTAPNWMKYQSYPQTIVRELLERERRSRTPCCVVLRIGLAWHSCAVCRTRGGRNTLGLLSGGC